MNDYKKILVTGAAGFIGFHLVESLISDNSYKNCEIFGLDIINDYYDVDLKYSRLIQHGIDGKRLKINEFQVSSKYSNYQFHKADISDFDHIVDFMNREKFDIVVNLAAQAGVRYSLSNPRAYTKSNIDGFLSILEGSRISNVKHLLYASSSSVYGLNSHMPLSEKQPTEHPISLYAATKKANEMFAHSYSHLYKIPTTGLRFFTVYGPWGRPDMALFLFLEAILKDKPINVFNNGKMVRDFTFIYDIVNSIKLLLNKPPIEKSILEDKSMSADYSTAPFHIFNIGNSNPVQLIEYIDALEKAVGKKAIKNFMDMQPGDVPITHSDTSSLEEYINFKPQTSIEDGVDFFVNWYKSQYLKSN